MNPTIKDPARFLIRAKKRALRRKRPAYPALQPHECILVSRPECGETRRFLPVDKKTGRSPTRALSGQFVFCRS
jgi:hypothetical protein